MLSLFRIILTLALIFGFTQAAKNAGSNPHAGDMANAFWVAFCVVVGLLASLTWVPLIGDRMVEPVSGGLRDSVILDRPRRLMRLVRWFEAHSFRRLARWLCFIEGVRRPWLPGAFVAGMNNARPGSWLEFVYAREVFRFNNLDNCVKAFQIMRQRGHTPPPHANADIQFYLTSLEVAARPGTPTVAVPPTTDPPLRRNLRIRLHDDGDAPGEPPAAPPADAGPGKEEA